MARVPRERPEYRDPLELLPDKIRARFEYLDSQIEGVIEEAEAERAQHLRLSTEDRELVRLLVFTSALEAFFRGGTKAALSAVNAFSEFGVTEIRVGGTSFSKNSADARRGERLANQLRSKLSQFEGLPINYGEYDIPEATRMTVERIRLARRLG